MYNLGSRPTRKAVSEIGWGLGLPAGLHTEGMHSCAMGLGN